VGTYEAAELLEPLEHTRDDECSAIPALRDELCEVVVDSADFGLPSCLICLWDVSVSSRVFFLQDFFFNFSQDMVD
jgi:hypothetical protein